jgi:hypothetical protein
MSEENKNIEEEKSAVGNQQLADNSQQEIIPAAETSMPEAEAAIAEQQTTDPKRQTEEEMEVHHHAHAAHGKKNWRSYFWEFLMLFLAVFCGFLAENQREHMVEHQREKKFIKSLVSDLEVDTARLNHILLQRHRRSGMLDSFVTLLNRQDAAAYGRYLYYFNSFATRGPAFRYTPVDGTMQQLKNAGNLRLIRKSAVNDSIIAYDVHTRALVWGSQDEEEIMDTYRNIAEGIFDGRVLMSMRDEDNNVFMTDYDPPLRITVDAVFRLNYRIHMLIAFNKTLRRDVRIQLQKAVNLLTLLKKEYHLE